MQSARRLAGREAIQQVVACLHWTQFLFSFDNNNLHDIFWPFFPRKEKDYRRDEVPTYRPIDSCTARAGCLEFINVKANSERRVSLYLCLSCLSLRWERVSGVVGINVFDYCFNQNIFLFFFPARRRTEGKFLFLRDDVFGGENKRL
jgi:hypothetical protein